MDEAKLYYVTIDTGDIHSSSLPESGIEFEIKGNDNDIKKLQDLFMKRKKFGDHAASFLGKPFNEWGVDEDRQAYSEIINEIYKKIYKIGTIKTREKIHEMGIL